MDVRKKHKNKIMKKMRYRIKWQVEIYDQKGNKSSGEKWYINKINKCEDNG